MAPHSSTLAWKIPWMEEPGGIKNPHANAGDMSLILELGRASREGNGNPLHYSCLVNLMDRGLWWVLLFMGLQKSQTHNK